MNCKACHYTVILKLSCNSEAVWSVIRHNENVCWSVILDPNGTTTETFTDQSYCSLVAQTHYTGGAPTAPGEDRIAEVVAWLEVDVQWSSRPAVHVVPKFHTLVDRRLECAWDQPYLVSQDMWGRCLHVHVVTCHISLFDVHSVYNCREGTAFVA